MKAIFALISIVFHLLSLSANAELSRWQKWELERNDLHMNPAIYHSLPARLELESYQTETLLFVDLEPGDVGVVFADPESAQALNLLRTPEGKIRFFIHPKATALFQNIILKGKVKTIKAIPTTSPRTFFVDNFLVKVSLSEKINGAIRTVYPLQMQRATIINQLLGKTAVRYLKEPLGIYDKTAGSPFGFLIREIPERFISGTNTLVPLLSYVASHPDGSLLQNNANALNTSQQNLIIDKILPALLNAFYSAARHGIAIEAHQQNTLLELDKFGNFTGEIYFRDLDGCRVDFNLRKKLGFNDHQIEARPEFDWIFDSTQVAKLTLNMFIQSERPSEWSGLIEKAYQTYLLGSSIYLLQKSVSGVSLKKEILKQTSNLRAAPLCRQVLDLSKISGSL